MHKVDTHLVPEDFRNTVVEGEKDEAGKTCATYPSQSQYERISQVG